MRRRSRIPYRMQLETNHNLACRTHQSLLQCCIALSTSGTSGKLSSRLEACKKGERPLVQLLALRLCNKAESPTSSSRGHLFPFDSYRLMTIYAFFSRTLRRHPPLMHGMNINALIPFQSTESKPAAASYEAAAGLLPAELNGIRKLMFILTAITACNQYCKLVMERLLNLVSDQHISGRMYKQC